MKKKYNIYIITIFILCIISIVSFFYIWYIDKIKNKYDIKAVDNVKDIENIDDNINEIIISKINEKSSKLEIIDYQLKFGREGIMEINCDLIYDIDTKQYCILEQSEINNVNITWESVLKQWDEYIKIFKCDTLFSKIWKKYCLEYQTILSKSK